MGNKGGETGLIWEGKRGDSVDHGKVGRQNGLGKVRGDWRQDGFGKVRWETGWIGEDKRGDRMDLGR